MSTTLKQIRERFSQPTKEPEPRTEPPPPKEPKGFDEGTFESLDIWNPPPYVPRDPFKEDYGMPPPYTLAGLKHQLKDYLNNFVRKPNNSQTRDKMKYSVRELLKNIIPYYVEIEIHDTDKGFVVQLQGPHGPTHTFEVEVDLY